AGGTVHHLDTSASLRRVIEVINALEPRPAFAVIGGGLGSPDMLGRNRTPTPAEDETPYHLFLDPPRPRQCSTYSPPGNHDHTQAFHQVMQTPVETVARAPGCPQKTFSVQCGSEPLHQEGHTMFGPGEYRPDPSAGITAPKDLPQPELVPYSRNDIRQPCPR